jgi:hypothetical protein
MSNIKHTRVLQSGLLALMLGGCAAQAVQPGASADAAKAAVVTPALQVASAPAAAKPAQPLPPPSSSETRYGIQIAQVGLTAAGGLVDVRFKVLDAAKAAQLLGNPANAPTLLAADNPPLMPPHHALKGARFTPGQVFYILYPNVRNTIKPGVEVTVAMGEVRLGPVTAQ